MEYWLDGISEIKTNKKDIYCPAVNNENICEGCLSGNCCAASPKESKEIDDDNINSFSPITSQFQQKIMDFYTESSYQESYDELHSEVTEYVNDYDMYEPSDSEILHRLLFNSTSPKDQPLEVIWESSNEEDEESHNSDRESYMQEENINGNLCYNRANSLVWQIENCFLETAHLLDRAHVTSDNSRTKSPSMDSSNITNRTEDNNPSLSMHETLNSQEQQVASSDDQEHDYVNISSCYSDNLELSNLKGIQCQPADRLLPHQLCEVDTKNNPSLLGHTYQNLSCIDYNSIDNLDLVYLDDNTIEELFRECFEYYSMEPNISVDACLRNLEILFHHLRLAKNEIIRYNSDCHIADKYQIYYNDLLFHEAITLLSSNKFNFIEKAIERAMLRDKAKFIRQPPLNELESKSHKEMVQNVFQDINMNENIQCMEHVSTFNSENNSRPETMTYEDSLELYKDNKELQESLLSILHSLHDIHDNFLKRRKIEIDSLHLSPSFIPKKVVHSTVPNNDNSHDYVNFPLESQSTDEGLTEQEAIRQITEISQELKFLWKTYYQTKSHSLKRSRSSTRSNLTLSTQVCYSLPNLTSLQYDQHSEFNSSSNISSHSSTDRLKNFVLQMRSENRKCYEITLEFLKKIMKKYGVDKDDIVSIEKEKKLFYPEDQSHKMAALHLAVEERDYLMWCSDVDFDKSVAELNMRGLVELVQNMQDAMAVEQQTFESLSQQLEQSEDPLLQQRLSAALCTSQTRLARLCARNMRCFTQQALKSRPKETMSPVFDSRSSSPRDSGLAISSCGGSDWDTDLPLSSPDSSAGGHNSFRNSLAFFQKATHQVSHFSRNNNNEDKRRAPKRGIKHNGKKSQKQRNSPIENNDLPEKISYYGSQDNDIPGKAAYYRSQDNDLPEKVAYYRNQDNDLCDVDDQETYEQVLFINGRPQFMGDTTNRSRSFDPLLESPKSNVPQSSTMIRVNDHQSRSRQNKQGDNRSRSCSWTRVRIGSNGEAAVVLEDASTQCGTPVDSRNSHRSVITSEHSRSLTDVSSIAVPKRKPVLNLYGVSSEVTNKSDDSDRGYRASRGLTRAHSCKEGLDYFKDSTKNESNLVRTRSCYGLASDLSDSNHQKPKLSRAPSIEEILESVKSLRVQRTMGKSSQEKASPQTTRFKSPRDKSKTSGLAHGLLVKPKESFYTNEYEKLHDDQHYYENLHDNTYENMHSTKKESPAKKEVIYDSPRPTGKQIDASVSNSYEPQLYENMSSEPTYMNVVKTKRKKSSNNISQDDDNLYANVETSVTNNQLDQPTYDVPKPIAIYDVPPAKSRRVRSKCQDENEYDTPRNNRSVVPHPITPGLLKAKSERIQKIDDIFADCEEIHTGRNKKAPDIPSPDYGSEEEEYIADEKIHSPPDYIDEGLGESDTRSYYADEQGLEVILEEPEDDYYSSHSSEESYRRHIKVERRSLDGSEGIGSAECDSNSGEEDSASSGIHSEDTPGQPIVEVNPLMQDNTSTLSRKEEDRTQKDRCVEVYPETIRQRQRNMAPSPSKVDIKNWEITDVTDAPKDKKLLPSVKALRNQFENGGRESSPSPTGNSMAGRSSATSSTSSLSMPSLDVTSSHASLNSAQTVSEYAESVDIEAPVEPIYRQFQNVDQDFKDVTSKPPSTIGWNPQPLLNKLYQLQPITKISSSKDSAFIDIEGYLEKLPCGRKKSTFWNAWKRRYFCAKKGVLYCYHNNQMDKLSMKLPLLGGKVEIMDPNLVSVEDGKTEAISSGMIGIDDGKGHYVVVRCASRNEAERWKTAIESHVIDDFESQYVQPWPMPMNPSLLRDTIVIDIGSCSVRAGVLASQATLPQLFFPSVVATNRETQRQIWGTEALLPEVRSISNINFPIKPSHKISKFSVDLNALSSLLQKTFADLNVDQKCYNVQLSVPRVLNPNTQTELMKMLFDQFGVKGVNLTHQSILALYAYNATSGIVVDIGERIDVVPIIDGYIVDGGVSRVPYGGYRILEHLRHYLFQKNLSLLNETESYIIRAVLEMICYCSQHYNTEKARCAKSPENFEKYAPLSDFFPNTTQFEAFHDISLNFGRFQATEGIFNPDAWGLDHPGLHKLVHKAIQECSMDIRKEMSKSIFLAGGVSQLPGLSERLRTELDNLTPPAVRPKVHCSPYRYHASYIGACVLAESDAFSQSKISREDWLKQGNSSLRKWAL